MSVHVVRKRALVTGGAGFIGSHLCDRLIAGGSDVVCLDNLSTGAMANIAHLLDHPRFTFVNHDVTKPVAAEVDEIFNLACPASPLQYQKDPLATMRTSVLGAMNLLDLAQRLNCPIFQASTSEVYGDPDQHPQAEGYWGNVNPIGPRACYDEGKRAAETLFFDYHRMSGTDVRVARIFNTYGPRMAWNDGRAVSNFITQALSGAPITIYGDGAQTRSFCYVGDMVEAIVSMMRKGAAARGPVNLGNPVELSIRDIAETVVTETGSVSKIIFANAAADDPRRRRPDISLAKRVLDWAPKVAFEDGLSRTISYFRAVDDAQAKALSV